MHENIKKKIIISIILFIILVLVIVLFINNGNKENVKENHSQKNNEHITENKGEVKDQEEKDSLDDKKSSKDQEKQKNETKKDSNTKKNSSSSSKKDSTNNVVQNSNKNSSSEIVENSKIHFPYKIEDESLIIEGVKSYDGLFIEDGSDSEISGVAAIVLTNRSKKCVEYAKINLAGSKKNYEFVVSGLKPGASVVLFESNKSSYVEQDYFEVNQSVANADSFGMAKDVLEVKETSDGQISVHNKSKKDIPCVRVFYKFYMNDKKLYVGGITYTAKIVDLKAGKTAKVMPSHYDAENSQIIMARVYNTKD